MRVRHPLTERHHTVELTEHVRRGGRTYQPGEQFAVLSITARAVHALDPDGRRVTLPVSAVLRVADAPAPPPPRPTLGELLAAGRLTTAGALRGAAS